MELPPEAAASLAGILRTVFLGRLADYGVATFKSTVEELSIAVEPPAPQLLGLADDLAVLIRARPEGHLPAVRPVLERLEALQYRLDPITWSSVLELAGE